MAGLKLSAKALETHDFLDGLLKQCDHLLTLTEQYAGQKGATQEQTFQTITRTLGHIRQNAMIKNLGPIADAAGLLGTAAQRGSTVQRTRTLREGLAGYKTNIERTMKAIIAADEREKKEQEVLALARKKAQEAVERERAAHEAELARQRAPQGHSAQQAPPTKSGEGS